MARAAPSSLCFVTTATLPSGSKINENSGMADSRLHANVFWCHEDSASDASPDAGYVYAINYDGSHRKSVHLTGSGIQRGQWEDMCYYAPGNTMWVANSGNNALNTNRFRAYKFAEPATLGDANTVLDVACTTYEFQWPDNDPRQAGNVGWDSECMMVDPNNGQLYFVTKSSAAATGLYTPENGTALVQWGSGVNMLEKVASLPQKATITAGDWAPDDSAFVTHANDTAAFVYNTTSFALMEQLVFPLPAGTAPSECCAFTRDSYAILRSREGLGSEVIYFPFKDEAAPPPPTPQAYGSHIWRSSSAQLLTVKAGP